MNIRFCFLVTSLFPLAVGVPCNINSIYCTSATEYQPCYNVNGEGILGTTVSCPPNQICNTAGPIPCMEGQTTISTTSSVSTTPTTTTTAFPITTPVCNGPVNYSAPQCNQYYRCIYVMWWWDYKLYTCPIGQAFNSISSQCAPSTTCSV